MKTLAKTSFFSGFVRPSRSRVWGLIGLLGLVGLSSSLLSGCVAIVAGGAAAGGTAYAMGDLTVPVEAEPERLQRAIQLGAQDLGLQFINGMGDETAGEYLFRNARDEKIKVSYETKSPVYYEMSIRVGTFGDEALSVRLNKAIQARL